MDLLGLSPEFRWRTCNAKEVSHCKKWCPNVIGRPYESCRARVGFRLNINKIDYYTLPTGLSCSCEKDDDDPDDGVKVCPVKRIVKNPRVVPLRGGNYSPGRGGIPPFGSSGGGGCRGKMCPMPR
jgi:hypothetical protein